MTLWIGLAGFLTLYFLVPILFGIRGALTAFWLPPIGFFLFGFYFLLQDPNFGTRISIFEAAGILFSGAFGGPFIFVFWLWLLGFPLAALGVWFHGLAWKPQHTA